ncbi:hypothetical protein M231_07719 [Tremella mesenterica]|uniref:Alginate lyase domain-containing protein n=1 Tax=Tremella mesenterica TaxID=5217 RepID=A0A4Q1BBB5_TREME|nr:hypothetical protein M231_07719 [Tremella mesenterica]
MWNILWLTLISTFGGEIRTRAVENQVSSYANVFFSPSHVINNTWFQNSHWSRRKAEWWATQLIAGGPWSVINKSISAHSGDPHDYLSYAVYYWPNCTDVQNTTELTPQEVWSECIYYQRDGVFNPDIYQVQNVEAVNNLTDFIYLAALAYASTGNPKWSSAINSSLYTFFIDPDTYMNPNLDYAQVVRGRDNLNQTGKHTGVLDLKGMAKLVSGVLILREMGAEEYGKVVDDGLMDWAAKQADWLENSDLGIMEKLSPNNHGTFYYNQLCSLYVLLGNTERVRELLEEYYSTIYQGQIVPSGDQPLESLRTRPYHYRAYNLAAVVTLARIGDYINLQPSGWTRQSGGNSTILDALKYAMAQDPATHNETDQMTTLSPSVAAIASMMGDPDGNLATFLKQADPFYPGSVYYSLNSGVSDSGIHQGLIETTYGPKAAQATAGMGRKVRGIPWGGR